MPSQRLLRQIIDAVISKPEDQITEHFLLKFLILENAEKHLKEPKKKSQNKSPLKARKSTHIQ
jgi:hypothetical protein